VDLSGQGHEQGAVAASVNAVVTPQVPQRAGGNFLDQLNHH
jgi:hypothetical protein